MTTKEIAILKAACAALRDAANKIEAKETGVNEALSVLDNARNEIQDEINRAELAPAIGALAH